MHESASITNATADQVEARRELFTLMSSYPASDEELERSMGLFVRGSLLARMLGTFEVYQQIVDLPGSILDLGTWRGQTAVLCENFRAIVEPLNFQRRVHAFDTFTGYSGFESADRRDADLFSDGTYGLPADYATLLDQILILHERNNAMGHITGKHRVWPGDVRETLAAYGEEHAGEPIALAWFDLNAMAPTRTSFEFVLDRLVPGGVIAFWQLTRGGQLPTEGTYYLEEILGRRRHTLHKTAAYPSLCYLRFEDGGGR